MGDYDWWYNSKKTALPLLATADPLFAINDKNLMNDRIDTHKRNSKIKLEGNSNRLEYWAKSVEFDA